MGVLFLLEDCNFQLRDLLSGLFELPPFVFRLLNLKPLHFFVLIGLLVDLSVEIHQLLLHDVQGLFEFLCFLRCLLVFLGEVFT